MMKKVTILLAAALDLRTYLATLQFDGKDWLDQPRAE